MGLYLRKPMSLMTFWLVAKRIHVCTLQLRKMDVTSFIGESQDAVRCLLIIVLLERVLIRITNLRVCFLLCRWNGIKKSIVKTIAHAVYFNVDIEIPLYELQLVHTLRGLKELYFL